MLQWLSSNFKRWRIWNNEKLHECWLLWVLIFKFLTLYLWKKRFETKSTKKLNKLNFQWTNTMCTLYQNNLKAIALFVTVFSIELQIYLVICEKTKENVLWELGKYRCMTFYLFLQFLWNLTFIFLGANTKLSLVLLLKPLTSVKENVTWFHMVQEFCTLKINITQFSDGFRLNFILVSDLQ